MKSIRIFCFYLLFLSAFSNLHSQDLIDIDNDSIIERLKNKVNFRNIDPRQYVEVYSIKKSQKNLIWRYADYKERVEKEGNRLHEIVDVDSEIQIEFDKQELSRNPYVKGKITIQGRIVSSNGGEAPVEVFPYTLIGEEKTDVGVDYKPPYEIANIFVNLLIESLESTKFKKAEEKINANDLYLLNERVKTILQYISYFKVSGEKVENIFLSFIQSDKIALESIERGLYDASEQIENFFFEERSKVDDPKNGTSIFDFTNISIDNQVESYYANVISQVEKLSRIRGSLVERIINPTNDYTTNRNYSDVDYADQVITAINGNKEALIYKLSIRASEEIYRGLDYATVNLKKERAKEGDYLYLYVVLEIKKNEEDQAVEKKYLPIGSYKLKNTKWQVKVSDSFLLVNRLNAPDPNLQGNENISPSNYKGAPGVSLLLTWRNDGDIRKCKDKKKNGKCKGGGKGLINFLEPSFGINVSYVDFSRSDDVEVGAGLILGLFNNKIFFTRGINLNSTGINERNSNYFGIGFSFANLAGKILKD